MPPASTPPIFPNAAGTRLSVRWQKLERGVAVRASATSESVFYFYFLFSVRVIIIIIFFFWSTSFSSSSSSSSVSFEATNRGKSIEEKEKIEKTAGHSSDADAVRSLTIHWAESSLTDGECGTSFSSFFVWLSSPILIG